MVNPDDFIITRKRKKYKFAKFANSPLCYEFEDWKKESVDVVELGAGTAQFSVELARRSPEKQFVAVDVKADRLQKGAYAAEELGLMNIRFLRARADQLVDCFQPESLTSLWLTFPDPYPKSRSAGRRMTHPTFLALYETLLKQSGSLYIKHDSPSFFTWTLEQLVAEKWKINKLSFDLHESNLNDDYKILTSYEQRWLNEGLVTNFVSATKTKTRGK